MNERKIVHTCVDTDEGLRQLIGQKALGQLTEILLQQICYVVCLQILKDNGI